MGSGGKSLHSPAYPAGSRSSSISRYGSGHAHAGEGWGVAARCNWSSWCAFVCRTRPEIGHWRSRPRRAFCPRVWKPRPPQTLSVAFANYTGANGLDQNKWFFPVRTMRNGPTQSCGNAEPRRGCTCWYLHVGRRHTFYPRLTTTSRLPKLHMELKCIFSFAAC